MSEIEKTDNDFCSKILKYPRIIDSLVILCEGIRGYLDIHSPEQIGELEYLPDANFWRQTIPYNSWDKRRPIFIPCGSRSDILRIYPKLIDLHHNNPSDSYLSPDKLFILIDLDIQCQDISNICPYYQTTEELYHAIYENNTIDTNIIDQSKIIITGWIHKEAYFLEPDLQYYLQNELYSTKITYKNNPLSLDSIYQDMIQDINNNADINKNLDNVLQRIEKFLSISIPDKNSLINECEKLHQNSTITPQEKRKLIEVILKIVKAKPYWEDEIIIEDDYLPENKAEDNVLLAIARFYAKSCNFSTQSNSTVYHIPQWVNFLYKKQKELNR
ncbi:ornithine acetyltransferase [Crocosphaera sp.]|uniref:ornithine acetyltransferase n=1 Tax=Crocosphaera sp. TaxID=2729996 RepID=UPI002615887A|nr:ornithine acetyltransferase [Crocosphaera sp.]MDJ0579801.1 ornithine acetyltransferase [Crocosphaera sp.]